MITLRLTEEEYEALKNRYRTFGTRNISELARLALQRLITGPAGPEDAWVPKLSDLDQRVRALESVISLLLARKRVTS
jgi:hypothetical protein